MNWTTKIYKYHKEWVAMVQALGGGSYSEDIVQEAYIKLDKYNCEHKIINKGKISKGYMFFVLRSIFINYINQSNKIRKINIDGLVKLNYSKESTSYNCNIKEIKEKFGEIHQKGLSEEVIKEQAFGKICNKMDEEISTWHWYDKKIFELYRDTPLSIRGLAKETEISSVNIFHTLKKGKAIMKEKFAEDYEDYKNGDYDLI
mgnify:CR=1 FL=1|tara:strand:+ start:75 stop:680 length:606 start_codon:yes stop_codon:yes gene_type:complete